MKSIPKQHQQKSSPALPPPSRVGRATDFITGIGLCSQTGTEPFALFSAVAPPPSTS
jgi:hypothetical protein